MVLTVAKAAGNSGKNDETNKAEDDNIDSSHKGRSMNIKTSSFVTAVKAVNHTVTLQPAV